MKLLELFLQEAVDPSTLDVDAIKPEQKDKDRAEGLRFQGKTFKGNNEPFEGEARKMAKLIKDPKKLVRRAKAVAALYGPTEYDPYHGRAGHYTGPKSKGVWAPFREALVAMGFTREQIQKIEEYTE